ncbi:MAG: hypothetical protein ACKVQR_14960 [Aquabacterium sp.]
MQAPFPSTLQHGEPELMRASEFQRYLDELEPEAAEAANTRLTSLSPSLLQDLLRFEAEGQRGDVLGVLAAAMRHGQSLTVHLRSGRNVVPLTVFPRQKLAHCPIEMDRFLAGDLAGLEVMQVERAVLRPPGDRQRALIGDAGLYAPVDPLLWLMALRGARAELLPELAGQAAYRVSPGLHLRGLPMTPELAAAVSRLRRATSNLRDVAAWPGLDRERACRLLNALYVKAGLIVSRTHPAATNEGWAGYR